MYIFIVLKYKVKHCMDKCSHAWDNAMANGNNEKIKRLYNIMLIKHMYTMHFGPFKHCILSWFVFIEIFMKYLILVGDLGRVY